MVLFWQSQSDLGQGCELVFRDLITRQIISQKAEGCVNGLIGRGARESFVIISRGKGESARNPCHRI